MKTNRLGGTYLRFHDNHIYAPNNIFWSKRKKKSNFTADNCVGNTLIKLLKN